MPIYTGDKLGFGVAPASGSGGGGYEVGYSTSFDNISHTKRVEHVWTVPKTARYNFEVWGADGGAGIAANGDNSSGGIPRYGRGGKVECSIELTVGTEIGICIGDNGLNAFAYTSGNTGNFLNDGEGGWGGFTATAGQSHADGGNSNYNMHQYGGGSNSPPRNFRGGGGGGGTIVRLYNNAIANGGDNDLLIIAGGGGGAGCRGDDHNNSNNQGGAGGNANDKVGETQWGRRGHIAGDTSYGWPTSQFTAAGSGQSNAGGNGGVGYYAGGAGGGGGDGGGGAGGTCSYCGTSGGSGGSSGQDGYNGSGGYNQSSGGAATSKGGGSYTKLGCGGNSNPSGGTGGNGGGGGGGYRGGGAGYWGNGSGHAGAGGGGGASSYVTSNSTYQVKGLNGLTASPRYTSEQKPLRLGNPGGGKVFIWEANKDPLGKNRPAEMTAQKIQYASRSTNGSLPATPLYYLGSSNNPGNAQDGGGPHYAAYNNYPYDISGNKCDAIVMNVAGSGKWELHSVTVGQAQGYDYPLPYRHKAWVHVIEGTETGGVGIHTEKFDLNNTTGNPAVGGWYGYMRGGSKNQNTWDGYQELFFEKPVVMNQGENYTIAVDWSCGGTVSSNGGGVACMNNGARTTQTLAGTNTGTVTWSDVTAYNGPHGLGSKNNNNGMVTDSAQGQLVNFGIKSYNPPGGGGGGGGGSYSTVDLICDLDASNSSSYGGSGSTWTNISSSGEANFTIDGATYSGEGSGSFYFDGSNDIVYSNSNYNLSSYNYIFVDIAFKADNATQIHLPFEHSQSWNNNNHGFGFAVHTDGGSASLNEHHSNHYGGGSQNWNYSVGTGWAVYGCQFAKTGTNNRKQYMNGQIVDFDNGNQYSGNGSDFGNYPIYIGSRYGGVAPAKGYIGYVRVYGSSSPLSAATILSNYNAVKSRYGL